MQNMPQSRILRQPAQDILQHCYIADIVMFLRRYHNHTTTTKNHATREIFIRACQYTK